jgi:NADH-quinone oxidoreductase subunit J
VTELVVFVVASLMVLGGAVGVILRPNPVHAALSMVLTLFGVAVHFVAMQAHFLAAVQVIVYAGAIVVLFLFVIMLLGVDKAEDLRVDPLRVQRSIGPLIGLAVAALVGTAVIVSRGLFGAPQEVSAPEDNIRALASSVFSDSVFAFELTSVLLVIAVVGAVLLARRTPKKEEG